MSVKKDNEVTLKIASSIQDFFHEVLARGFKITEKFILNDYYYIPKDLDLKNLTTREILSKAIIVRKYENITFNEKYDWLIFKKKEFDELGNILSQETIKVDLVNTNDIFNFLEKIEYKQLINIYEEDTAFENDKISFALKDVRDGEKLIESEIEEENPNKDSTIKIIENLKKENIPLDYSNYYVKKVEIEVNKLLGRQN